MLKAKQKTVSLVVACLTTLLTVLFAFAMFFAPTPMKTASAADTTIVFELGANGSAEHKDGGSDTKTYSETDGDYTLSLTGGTKMYPSSYDAKGNSCIKLGTGSAVGGFTFTAPDDVTSVIIAIAKYKENTSKITVNGTAYTLTKNSNDGAYDEIEVDTTSTKAISLTTVSGGARAMVNTITYVVATPESGDPTCEHSETAWAYDAETQEHYQQCIACEAEIEETRAACSEFTEGDYTTVDGKHTRTLTCKTCGGEQTETGNCEINAEYTRDGDTHTQTGACTICGDTTTLTENCTLTYSNVSNDDKTHTMTSSCSVCNIDVVTENVACTFESEAEGLTVTYTCKYCGYVYNEEVEGYTVTYVVPNGVTAVPAVEVAQGYTTTLPSADTVEGYTFVGWVEETLDQKTEIAPTFLTANSDYTVTTDITLYALYSYAEGTGAYTMVTDASTLAAGKQIVIASSTYDYALSTTQNSNNRGSVAITKEDDTITLNNSVQIITLENSTISGQFLFHVEGDSTGYLYAASTSSNHLKTGNENNTSASWTITIAANTGIATIKANQSARNWLRFNNSNNPKLFSCYTSGQTDVSIYMKNDTTYYVTEFNTCAHTNVDEVIEEATCTESGSRTVTCLDCESIIEAEVLPALGHNYVDDICENCGNQDPASIVYDGYYYLSVNGKYAGEQDSKYYKLFDALPDGSVDLNYVFYFVKNGETYDMYNVKAGLFSETVTIETQANYSVHILNSDGKILSHNTGYTNYQRLGFYATSNSYPADITLTSVELNANTESASITVGADLTLNYYVTMDEVLAEDAKMYITVGENEEEEVSYTIEDGRYKFSLEVPPQCMADLITATLKSNGLVLNTVEYSIKTYAQNKLNESSSPELKQLVSDMLRYGEAAQNYKDYNTGNLATNGVENLLAESDAVAPEVNASPVKNTEITSYPAYFTGATVFFNDVNQIFVRINTTENVTLTVNGVEVEELTSTTYKTKGILATEFDKEFTFALYHNGVLMQTLTYSVNAYAYRTQINTEADANMKALATALYRYGVSAKAYNA